MRNLCLALLFCACACAQIPTDTLVSKLASRDTPQKKFRAAHPAAVLSHRGREHATYLNPDGSLTALIGTGLTYQDTAGEYQDVDPQLWSTSTGGFRATGSDTPVRVNTIGNQTTLDVYNGTSTVSITTSKFTKTGDFTWTFPWAGLTWTLEVTATGWNAISGNITSARGSYKYQLPVPNELIFTPDAAGNLVSGTLTMTRAVMVRADKQTTPCSAWTVSSKALAFTCDDSTLPASAFPYYIDPSTTSYYEAASGDDGQITYCDADGVWPPQPGTYPDPCTNSTTTTGLYVGYFTDGYSLYYQDEAFFRFNTSVIPSNATVSAAVFNYYVTGYSVVPSENTYPVAFDWIAGSSWPMNTSMYASWPGSSAGSTTLAAIGGTGWKSQTLANVATYFQKAAWNGLRVAGNGSYTPTGRDTFIIQPWDAGSNAPYLTVTYNIPPTITSSQPTSGTYYADRWYTFTTVLNDANGASDLSQTNWTVGYLSNGQNACFVQSWPSTSGTGGSTYLENDAGSAYVDGGAFGTVGKIVQNTQCYLDVEHSTASWAGNSYTYNLVVKFKNTFTWGSLTKTTRVYVQDSGGAGMWNNSIGTWTFNTDNVPHPASASPNSGTIAAGSWQTVTFSGTDLDGYADIANLQYLAAYGLDGLNACYIAVLPNSNQVELLGDDGATWGTLYTLGTTNTASNSQCTIDVQNSSRTISGNTASASVRVQFKGGFTRGSLTKHSYVAVPDATSGQQDAWVDYGSWVLTIGGPKLIMVNQ